MSGVDSEGRTIWIVDVHRDDGKRFVVHADEKLTAFLKLEAAILAFWAFDCLQSNNRVTFFLRLTARIAATLA